jgi:hypothetical protein
MKNEETERPPPSSFFILHSALPLGVRFGLAETRDPVAGFPLAAFLEDFDALKALHDVAFAAQSGRGAKAAML